MENSLYVSLEQSLPEELYGWQEHHLLASLRNQEGHQLSLGLHGGQNLKDRFSTGVLGSNDIYLRSHDKAES